MATMTYGTYIINDSTAPTSAWDPSAHSEGSDYVKFANTPKLGWNVEFVPAILKNPGGSHISINMGDFSEQFTIDDKLTPTQLELVGKFVKTHSQPLTSSNLYVIVILTNTPTLKQWYQNSAVAWEYLPVRFSGISTTWDENEQLYKTRLVVEACWP